MIAERPTRPSSPDDLVGADVGRGTPAGPPSSLEDATLRAEQRDLAHYVRLQRDDRTSDHPSHEGPDAEVCGEVVSTDAPESRRLSVRGSRRRNAALTNLPPAVRAGVLVLGAGAVAWTGYRLMRIPPGAGPLRTVLSYVARGFVTHAASSIAQAAVASLAARAPNGARRP